MASREKANKNKEFIAGVLYACQELVISRDQPVLAQDIIESCGFTLSEWLRAQRKSGYESRKMNKVIREAFD